MDAIKKIVDIKTVKKNLRTPPSIKFIMKYKGEKLKKKIHKHGSNELYVNDLMLNKGIVFLVIINAIGIDKRFENINNHNARVGLLKNFNKKLMAGKLKKNKAPKKI